MSLKEEFILLIIWFIICLFLRFILQSETANTIGIILFGVYIYIVISSHVKK